MSLSSGTFSISEDLRDLLVSHDIRIGGTYAALLDAQFAGKVAYNTPAMRGLVETLLSTPAMVAFNLLQNAVDEAKGGTRVRIIAERHASGQLRSNMLIHAEDEFRHARQFLSLLRLTGLQTTNKYEGAAEEVQDVFNFDDDLILFIARVHSIEIRSWTILRLYIDVLQAQVNSSLKSAIPVLSQILADEARHVAYTGAQLNLWLDEIPGLFSQVQSCFSHTNDETWEDFARMARYLASNHETALQDKPLV